jgi:hypothetical protein
MFNLMTQQCIRRDNHDFRGTGGLSENNRAAGFLPAFCRHRRANALSARDTAKLLSVPRRSVGGMSR